MNTKNIPEYSLDIIKIVIETAKVTSPEREELKKDLQYIVETIESNSKEKAIICNKAICAKYPPIIGVANKYDLHVISEKELSETPQITQIMILHRIAHYLRDRLSSETIKVKGEAIIEGAAKSALGYAAKQILSSKD